MDELAELRERMGRTDAMRTCIALLIAWACGSSDAIATFVSEAKDYSQRVHDLGYQREQSDNRRLLRAERSGFVSELSELEVTARSLLLP